MNARDQLEFKVERFREIKTKYQIVSNNMTNNQQYLFTKRKVMKVFNAAKKLQYENCGRVLLDEAFPELATVIEKIFDTGQHEIEGGLESHPRLITETLFQSTDNLLTMPQARDFVLQVAPVGFQISLWSIYNYTDTYNEQSIQSKQHQLGKGVNANISLKSLPEVSYQKMFRIYTGPQKTSIF